ncbi:MAG TPA: helix-turn-helix transcriptional regulator [Actinophytocola sp.]|uniref:helix-turn-helix domain-containing protein n=1 Tax=Actinophytocola sp. TaxID=1872138 RepID=UPI002DDD5D4B|nr:helix-turn-helix transcriptional regulator [Actinophytocola sp.]HEV2779109.1 helix-turn-helix transcriptional regulator [Actinophytocola sp.]
MARKPLTSPFRPHLLQRRREQAGLSIVALARRCKEQGHEVHASAIGKVERGVNGPSPELLKALARALGVEVSDLLDKSEAVAS